MLAITEASAEWAQLCQRLADRFPELPSGAVMDEVFRAKGAAEAFSLSESDQLDICERMARNHLMVRSGQILPSARLDPESHDRRRKASA